MKGRWLTRETCWGLTYKPAARRLDGEHQPDRNR
jgi:hypothetical protein